MTQFHVDSFCDRLDWIQRNSQGRGLEKLDRYQRNELTKAIYNAQQTGNPGFTDFELEVLSLVVSYCCYFQNRFPTPFSRFEDLKKPTQYYRELERLVSSGQGIACDSVLLSSLVKDDYVATLLCSME